MKVHSIYKCPSCPSKKKYSLVKKNKGLRCVICKSFFPYYKNIPVMLTFKNDFYHLKKALTFAKDRVNKFEN
jgi:hypothetical protein